MSSYNYYDVIEKFDQNRARGVFDSTIPTAVNSTNMVENDVIPGFYYTT